MRYVSLFLLFPWLVTASLSAQSTGGDIASIRIVLDQATIDNFVSTGSLTFTDASDNTYNIDEKRLYFNTDYAEVEAEVFSSEIISGMARIQLLNHKLELLVDEKVYELGASQIAKVKLGEDEFILLPDPIGKKRERRFHQLHYSGERWQLMEQHYAEWQEVELSSSYGEIKKEQVLRRVNRLMLLSDGEFSYIKSAKDLTTALGIPKKGEVAKFIKRNKLKVNQSEDAVKLLEYLEKN